MKPIIPFIFTLMALFLSACSPAAKLPPVVSGSTETAPASTQETSEGLTRTDQQGVVVVSVTPLNLNTPGQTLDFEVSMETHSVELSMDLTTLATLATDTGLQVQAISWEGPRGGHHISGTLSFPATADGKPLPAGASQLTLTIISVDAAARTFTWDITP